MAGETNTDRIRELERENSTLVERVDYLKRDIERAEGKIEHAFDSTRDLDKRLSLLIDRMDRLEKRLDELSARRWEISKIVIAAVVGAIVTAAGFLAKGVLDQRTGVERASPPVIGSDRKP